MAKEEIIKQVRLRSKVSTDGKFWDEPKPDNLGIGDIKLTLYKRGRKDYFILFEPAIYDIPPAPGDPPNFTGRNRAYDITGLSYNFEPKPSNDIFKTTDDFVTKFIDDLNIGIKSPNSISNPLHSFPSSLSSFGKYYSGLTQSGTQSLPPFYEIVQTPFDPAVVPSHPEGYFDIWNKWVEEDKKPIIKPIIKPEEPAIVDSKLKGDFKFNVEKKDIFVIVPVGGSYSVSGELKVITEPADWVFDNSTNSDDELDDEYGESEINIDAELGIVFERPMETQAYKSNLSSSPDDVLDTNSPPSGESTPSNGEAVKNPTVAEAIVTVMNALIKEGGLSVNEAAGVCGNIKAESGFKFWNIEDGASNIRPGGMGSDRWNKGKATGQNYSGGVFSGTGLAQWTYGRRYNYEKYVGEWLTKKGVTTKALKNGIFDTDPGLHGSDYSKVYGGAGDKLEAYLKTVPYLFDAACSFLQHELKSSYSGIIKIMRGASPSGNTNTLIKNGFFVNKSGGKVSQTVEGFAELVVCNFEVPGPVGSAINGKGGDAYKKLVSERTKLAQDCLATYNKSKGASV